MIQTIRLALVLLLVKALRFVGLTNAADYVEWQASKRKWGC
jgi:hypothetical protein